jgi:hypothetical protein
VIAYQDQAWGDGEILLNYRCTPGTPGDRYRSGYKTTILISRREVKDKGDVNELNIEWGIRRGFLRQAEQGETHVTHRLIALQIAACYQRYGSQARTRALGVPWSGLLGLRSIRSSVLLQYAREVSVIHARMTHDY